MTDLSNLTKICYSCSILLTGGERFCQDIEKMIGYRPFVGFKWCWMFFTPGISLVRFVIFKDEQDDCVTFDSKCQFITGM